MRKADIWKRFPGRKGGREGEREEMGSGEPLTVFGEEKREEKTIGFGSMITRCKNRSLVDYIWKGVMEIR